MSQFVGVVGAKCREVSYIAQIPMENVLLKFDLCAIVVINTGSEFCGLFHKTCFMLNIRFRSDSKSIHKDVDVEQFHEFLNHSQRIFSEE